MNSTRRKNKNSFIFASKQKNLLCPQMILPSSASVTSNVLPRGYRIRWTGMYGRIIGYFKGYSWGSFGRGSRNYKIPTKPNFPLTQGNSLRNLKIPPIDALSPIQHEFYSSNQWSTCQKSDISSVSLRNKSKSGIDIELQYN